MALTNWNYSVTNIKVTDEVNAEGVTLENAVCQTYWKVTAEDEAGNQAEWHGATPFSAKNVPSDNFISFADLQESDVINWISAAVEADPTFKEHIGEMLQRNIDENKRRDVKLPWAVDEVLEDDEGIADPVDPESDAPAVG